SRARGSGCRSVPCRSSCGSTIRRSREKRGGTEKAGLMFRFLILLLGMLTTRAGKLEAPSFRPAEEDDWEEPGPWLEGPRYAADDGWIVAREPAPATRRRGDVDAGRPHRPDRIPRGGRRRIPRWVAWAAVLTLV